MINFAQLFLLLYETLPKWHCRGGILLRLHHDPTKRLLSWGYNSSGWVGKSAVREVLPRSNGFGKRS